MGGGPAGLAAAIEAADSGARTLLLEGGPETGRKLLITGKGRCNLTNDLPVEQFTASYGAGGRFLRNAFSRFFSGELLAYLAEMGVETKRERGGRFYPGSGGAKEVRDALLGRARERGVAFDMNRRVTAVTREEDVFFLKGEGFAVRSRTVVVATGGASWPETGSRGDGYRIARSFGHRVGKLVPALVPVRCSDTVIEGLDGLRLKNVKLAGPGGTDSFGEVHFTHFGISGPAVFPLSRSVAEAAKKGPVLLTLDFKPALDEKKLDARLRREIEAAGGGRITGIMEKLLPRQAVGPFLLVAGIDPKKRAAEVPRETRRSILALLKAFPLTATGTLPLERAMVTSGGVSLREIDPRTMESRLVPGLFFCGEVLDIDGTTGGFNLQAAFSTGVLGGRGAAEAAGR